MKPGGLRRTTELQRGGPLARRVPLRSRRARQRRAPLVDVIGNERLGKELVFGRSNGWCEIQLPGCHGRAIDWHHRRLRSQGGRWDASNGLAACRWCHEAVTNTRGRRAEYEANGWLVSREAIPAAVPVLLANVGWALLDDDGGYELVVGDAA